MKQSTTLTAQLSSDDSSTQPVRVRNACCPKCDGPVYYQPERWLYCTRCSAHRRPIPFVPTERRAAR
jgi:hypothetical protein